MAYHIEQEDKYLGNERWHWSAWIGASDKELDAVDHVTWYLHATFDEPIVEVDSRVERFAIERISWGTFQLRADVVCKNAVTRKLRHELRLHYPETEAEAPAKDQPFSSAPANHHQSRRNRVFLSYGIEDRNMAASVRDTLEKGGYRVLDSSQVVPGDPWQASIQKMIRESDMVLGLVTSQFASPNLVTELNNAGRANKPAIALVSPGVGTLFGLDEQSVRTEVNLADPASGSELLHLVKESLGTAG